MTVGHCLVLNSQVRPLQETEKVNPLEKCSVSSINGPSGLFPVSARCCVLSKK